MLEGASETRAGHRHGADAVGESRGESGQSLVEFALLLPLILAILLGTVEFGRGFQVWLTLSNASASGARVAAVRQTEAQVEAAVRDAAVTLDQAALAVLVDNAQGAQGQPVTVTVNYTLPLMTPFFVPLVADGGLSLSASATQPLE